MIFSGLKFIVIFSSASSCLHAPRFEDCIVDIFLKSVPNVIARAKLIVPSGIMLTFQEQHVIYSELRGTALDLKTFGHEREQNSSDGEIILVS